MTGGPPGWPILDLHYPFTGRWLVQNSPAQRVPSHGTTAFASSYAIDFVPVDDRGRTAPVRLRTLLRPEPPDRFPGFGRPVLAPVDGTVVAVHGTAGDHVAFRGLPSVGYVLAQGRRAAQGWLALAGNHVVIRAEGGGVVALCHLRQATPGVAAGDRVTVGQIVGACGNSGNTTEPHLHLQAMDRWDPERATARPVSFRGVLPANGTFVQA